MSRGLPRSFDVDLEGVAGELLRRQERTKRRVALIALVLQRFIHDSWSSREIAEDLGMTPAAVRKIVERYRPRGCDNDVTENMSF